MSRFHYIRMFQRVYGVTPKHYLRDLRIAKAKLKLQVGEPVTRVCTDVGYESVSTFSNVFKEQLVAKGVEFSVEPKDVGALMLAVFDDTCGNFIQITQEL